MPKGKAAPKQVAAPITVISKYRALIHHLATVELGFTHTQPATMVDQYTKGKDLVTLYWGGSKLISFQATKDGTPGPIEQGKASMLQRAQTALGKAIALEGPGSKWNLSTKAKGEFEALALATFKVVEPVA